MLAIIAAVGSPAASAPIRIPGIAASAKTASTGSSRTVVNTSAANRSAGPQINKSRAAAN